MKKTFALALLVFLLAACGASSTPQPGQSSPVATPSPVSANTQPTPLPPAPTAQPKPQVQSLPGQSAPRPALPTPSPASNFAPQAGDAKLTEGPVFIENARVVTIDGKPVLALSGSLPTPCHALRLKVSPPSGNKRVEVRAYSVSDPERMCAQVIAPLNVAVSLDGLPAGEYTLVLNGDVVGVFTV